MRIEKIAIFCTGIVVGLLLALPLYAQSWISWNKTEVVPMVLVKPAIGGFVAVEGSSIGNAWSKDEVTPILLVKPLIGGFAPREGSSIGNVWRKEEVKPFISVKPSLGRFVPSEAN